MYIVDTFNYVVRKVDPHGVIHTFAGNISSDNKCSGGVPTNVGLDSPQGIAVDDSGNVYIADAACGMVFKVDAAGKLLTIVAGGLDATSTGDGGPATSTLLAYPVGVAVDSAGTLHIADSGSSTIRAVDKGGIIHTLAGNGTADYTGDRGPAKAAALSSPKVWQSIEWATSTSRTSATMWCARSTSRASSTRSPASSSSPGYGGDEGPATAAQLQAPQGVAVDSYGGVYIANTGNNVIRNVDTSHIIHTFAGNGTGDFGGDGGPAAAGQFALPGGLAEYDTYPHPSVGDIQIYVADTVNNRVRLVSTPAVHVAP